MNNHISNNINNPQQCHHNHHHHHHQHHRHHLHHHHHHRHHHHHHRQHFNHPPLSLHRQGSCGQLPLHLKQHHRLSGQSIESGISTLSSQYAGTPVTSSRTSLDRNEATASPASHGGLRNSDPYQQGLKVMTTTTTTTMTMTMMMNMVVVLMMMMLMMGMIVIMVMEIMLS